MIVDYQDRRVTLSDIEALARRESAKQYHFFIGVEHLFIALTQLKGGVTQAVLEYHGLSPRFVRYSIRETIGQYENRRYWPGYPETPRARWVLDLAKRYAGLQSVAERDLLLAILDENDSVVIRVLEEMGGIPSGIRHTVANWTSASSAQRPEVEIVSLIKLNSELEEDERLVLQEMFRAYEKVEIVREFTRGVTNARVFLVHPVKSEWRADAPVVVKIDDRQAILQERRRFDVHVKNTLPASAARLLDAPVVPDKSRMGGLKYTFVGRIGDTAPVSLREVAQQLELTELSRFINELFVALGQSWWQHPHPPYRFFVWREYEHVLPAALVLEALPYTTKLGPNGHELKPLGVWSRNNQILPGELVALNGFVVQKYDTEHDTVQLAAGAQPEAINRASKVKVRGLGIDKNTYFRGQVVERIVGRVVSTRDDLLMRALQNLEPYFDLRRDYIPSRSELVPDLPNPIMNITQLLDQQVSGHLSTIHGDMHLENILVGPMGDAWLIDFSDAREGHALFDWAFLELSFLGDFATKLPEADWAGPWQLIGLLSVINRGLPVDESEFGEVGRASPVIQTIRDVVRKCLVVVDKWNEYYVALALMALRMMDWDSTYSLNGRRLAFLISALATAAVQSPRDMATMADYNWVETATVEDLKRTAAAPATDLNIRITDEFSTPDDKSDPELDE